MTDDPTARAQVEAMLEQEVANGATALIEKDAAGYQRSEDRSAAFQEVLAVVQVESPTCEHQWVMHMTQMPDGLEKPGSTSCRVCGEVGTDVIVSGTAAIEVSAVPTEEDLGRLSQLRPHPVD